MLFRAIRAGATLVRKGDPYRVALFSILAVAGRYLALSSSACATARQAIGTEYGEQET